MQLVQPNRHDDGEIKDPGAMAEAEEVEAAWLSKLASRNWRRSLRRERDFAELASNERFVVPTGAAEVAPDRIRSRLDVLAQASGRTITYDGANDGIAFLLGDAVRMPKAPRRGRDVRRLVLNPLWFAGLFFDVVQLSDMIRDAVMGTFILDFDVVAARMFVLCLALGMSMTLYLIADRGRGRHRGVLFWFGLTYIYMSAFLFGASSFHLFASTRFGVMTQLGYAAVVGIGAALGYGLCVLSGRTSWRHGLLYGVPFFLVFLFQLGLVVLSSLAGREKTFGWNFVGNFSLMMISGLYGLAFVYMRDIHRWVRSNVTPPRMARR